MENVNVWRYDIPPKKGEGWAIIVLDERGFFGAVSDFGDYAHLWSHHGEDDFREFFLDSKQHSDYFERKLRTDRVYDGAATETNIRRHILEYRRDGAYTADFAREEWDLLENSDIGNDFGFQEWLGFTRIGEAYEFAVYDTPAEIRRFVSIILPRLEGAIRAELDEERSGGSHAGSGV